MTILNLIENCGFSYKKKATTRGGEYSGPCPGCGGNDSFSIHPTQNHFVCRQCHKAGDSIAFLKDFHGKTYIEACKELNINPKISYKALDTATEKPGQNEIIWYPRPIIHPDKIWQDKAAAFLFEAYKYLLSPAGKIHRDWLNNRGISNSTIKTARMGWNTCSISFDRSTWGLTPETDQNGKNKQIWIPVGLLIPQLHNDKPIRLRIRQSNPDTTNRFIMVPGSAMGYFDYRDHLGLYIDLTKPALITEAEIDGWLLYEKLGDLFNVYAVGNSSARPDLQTHNLIKNNTILLNLDDDTAGHAEIYWWRSQYPDMVPYFSGFGKDPGESFEVGVDIRAWGEEGLGKLPQIKNKTAANTTSHVSFKEKVLEKYKQPEKQEVAKQPVKQPANFLTRYSIPKSTTNLFCVHNKYCQSLQNGVCLIDKTNPWDTMVCPKNNWYTYTTGPITEIILGPGIKKQNRK
jgi:hypothetical protein